MDWIALEQRVTSLYVKIMRAGVPGLLLESFALSSLMVG